MRGFHEKDCQFLLGNVTLKYLKNRKQLKAEKKERNKNVLGLNLSLNSLRLFFFIFQKSFEFSLHLLVFFIRVIAWLRVPVTGTYIENLFHF